MAKVLLLNGSPHTKGCTAALQIHITILPIVNTIHL